VYLSKFPFRQTAFWVIFITLMLPVEVRIYPTYTRSPRSQSARYLCGPDAAADRIGDRRCCSGNSS